MIQIIHIIQSLTETSGVTTFVSEVALLQKSHQRKVSICCQSHADVPVASIPVYTSPNVEKMLDEVFCIFDVNKAEYIVFPKIIHIHGVWSFYCLRSMHYCQTHRIPYVVSPHGGLMPRVFTKGRLKKFLFWHLLLKPLLKRAAAIHCTSEAEEEACRKLGLKGPFVIAPLGVYLPDIDLRQKKSEDRVRTILFLGRLGEEKGLLNLLSVWKRIHSETYGQNWVLKLAGPDWLGYKKNLDAKIASEHIGGVVFTGTADEALKDRLYREADIFVLPSPMENFSMVVLEALAYGVPAIATKGTPWQELETEHCGLWIEQGEEALFEALSRLMKLSDSERQGLGANGRALASAKYQWPAIAEKLLDTYRAVCK